ncbi:hypothetical protein MLD38_006924 [Melastoma candidum]|uniref:Uncharacterized protein n=1 Tax=Melastoma candidum TaxID=119954 RepID=A0ACB9RPH1_9MYRT|nr:hypothetical protein MLD38_006924 [Melastoma candidum]
MEEMSTVTLPFRLKNMNGEESALKAQIEIAGTKVAGLLAKHRVDFGKLIGADGEKDIVVISDGGQLVEETIVGAFDEKCAILDVGGLPLPKDSVITELEVKFEPEPKQGVLEQQLNGHGVEKSVVIIPEASHRTPVSDYVPLWGITSICGGRSEMEDAGAVVPRLMQIPSEMLGAVNKGSLVAHFFGVYDGHGGSQVADYCSRRIHTALVEEMETEKLNFCDQTVLGRGHLERAFSGCFQKVDAEVGGVSRGEDGKRTHIEAVTPDTVGSTAVIALICSTHIIIANCGDSRAVLYRGKDSIPLSVDHKPNRPDERERIEALGGKVIHWLGYRVSGVLAMSRSIGDRHLKPSIIPDPEVLLLPRAREDECLILASDGLWDVISNEEACETARKRILLWHKKNGVALDASERGNGADPAAQAAADHLTRLAIQRGSRDNITVIVVDLKAQRKFKKKASPDSPIIDKSKS